MSRLITLLIAVMVLSSFSVLANDQPIVVDVSPDIQMVITPGTLDFGPVVPDSLNNPATNGPIGFNPAGSNVDVTVEVTGVTGFPFDTGLMLDTLAPVSQIWNMPCAVVGDLCTYTPATTTPTLNVPLGAPAGVSGGTITYSVTETA